MEGNAFQILWTVIKHALEVQKEVEIKKKKEMHWEPTAAIQVDKKIDSFNTCIYHSPPTIKNKFYS